MKIPPGFAPSKVCARSKDEVLAMPAGADPYLVRDDDGTPWLVSTCGYAAMALRVEEADEDQDGAVPVDAVSAAEKHQDDDWNPSIACGEKDAIAQLTKDSPHLTLIAPRTTVLFPPVLDAIAKAAGKHPDGLEVSFNVRLLARLAKGLGVEQVTVRRVSHGADYWLVVLPATDLGTPAVGILQPLSDPDRDAPVIPVVAGGKKKSDPVSPDTPEERSRDGLVCSACGKPTSSTVSLQTEGQNPTPSVCLDCMRRATDEVKATKGRGKGGRTA